MMTRVIRKILSIPYIVVVILVLQFPLVHSTIWSQKNASTHKTANHVVEMQIHDKVRYVSYASHITYNISSVVFFIGILLLMLKMRAKSKK